MCESEYDVVRVYFLDGTFTTIHVDCDFDIIDAIIDLCESEGYPFYDVTYYSIIIKDNPHE